MIFYCSKCITMKKFNPNSIKMLRQIYNLKQSEFARRLKTVNRQDVHNWESGRSIPSIKSLLNIVNTFNTSIEIFFENDIYYGNKRVNRHDTAQT
jgi:DNA-binding transcriptional regulator YiaG